MSDIQKSHSDEQARVLKLRQEQQQFDEKRRQEEKRRLEEKERLEKKAFEDKKADQLRSADEAKRLEDKRRDEKKLDGDRKGKDQTTAAQSGPEATDPGKKPGEEKKDGLERDDLTKREKNEYVKSAEKANQTPFASPENKPTFAAPKKEDPKLQKPTTLAERTAIRNMDKAIENERAGRTKPPGSTVERAVQAEEKLQQARDENVSKTKKTEQHKSSTMEKSL